MRKITLVITLLLLNGLLFAQLNMRLLGERSYDVTLNDVWGWVAPDGTEYALVGTRVGVSIVSLADPTAPVEVAFLEGPNSGWRDIKTWEHYAYVTNETNGGLHVIDLAELPGTVRDTFLPMNTPLGELESAHNLYIDEAGICYLAGTNLTRGGPLMLDLNNNPWNPEYIGFISNTYAHDIYVRDNLAYVSEINVGRMAIYDLTDKEMPLLLGIQKTPFTFTHNIWLSDDGTVAFTTDEQINAPVAAYDVSDPENIRELDQFRPAATLATGNIPHNVHVWDDWLILSYYGDGGIIVDASRPTNLVEVGNFDTFLGRDLTRGAWGAYPFLPSGIVLVTDITDGLFVLEPTYVRAAWLEGKITDAATGAPVFEVEVEIGSEQPNYELSDLQGNYKTGQAIPGTFEVRFFKPGYLPATATASLKNGELTILDIALNPAGLNQISGITLRDEGGAIIEGAMVQLEGIQGVFQDMSDEEGLFQIQNVYEGTYQLYAGKWGYLTKALGSVQIKKDTAFTVQLQSGYQDEFYFDFGWQHELIGENTRGPWTLGEPIGTYLDNGDIVNPELDVPDDIGDACYQTGNVGGSAGTDDVDNAVSILRSPPLDLATYQDPVLTYYAWFYNGGGNTAPNDSLLIKISNGQETVVLESIGSDESMGAWRPETFFHLRDFIELTDNMQLIIETSDLAPDAHLVEAALDFVRVRELDFILSDEDPEIVDLPIKVFPNPFREALQLDLRDMTDVVPLQLRALDPLGRQLLRVEIPAGTPLYQIPTDGWAPGTYFLQLQTPDRQVQTLRVVKVK